MLSFNFPFSERYTLVRTAKGMRVVVTNLRIIHPSRFEQQILPRGMDKSIQHNALTGSNYPANIRYTKGFQQWRYM